MITNFLIFFKKIPGNDLGHSLRIPPSLAKYIRFAHYFSVREGFEPSIRKLTRITG